MATPTSPSVYRLFVGIDIAAASATVVAITGADDATPPLTIAQTPSGFAQIQHHLLTLESTPQASLVVLEATGSYWISLATTLATAGFAVSVINPHQAHHFAKALLKRAKTDTIDAHTLARLAALLQPPPWTPPPAVYTELEQRLTQRDALLDLRQQVRNQLHALEQGPVVIASVRARMEALIGTLTEQLATVEAEIMAVLAQDAAWAAAATRLQTIPGIGLLTATLILVHTLNFSLCQTPEEAAAYAGLAPNPRQSGTSVRGRSAIGHTGNRRLRTALYLATLSAAQHNPVIRPFYQRLRAAGKPGKVARCAAARKLLHLAWAVTTKARDFDPTIAGSDAAGGSGQ